MKILLTAINAKYIHANLAVYSLAAYAKECDANIKIAEYTINHQKEEILKGIYQEKADVVAFSCYIWNIDYVLEITELLGQVAPDVRLWLGGPEVSYDARALLQAHPEIDGVMCGEGEEVFKQLVLHDMIPNERIPGLVYRDGAEIYTNVPAGLMDMDCLPFVYDRPKDFEHKIIYYESSRGCPFSCSYCLSSVDKKVRFKSTELVKNELKLLIDAKVPQVKFVDRTFNCRHKHTMEIWKFIRDHDNGVTNFHFEITADLINDEEIELLNSMRPGLVQLEIGVQSTNPQTLKEIRRVMDFEQLSEVVRKIDRGHNVHQHLDLIAGLPYEDLLSFKNSFNDVYSLKPEQLQLGFLKVLKGSWMHENQEAYGLVYTKKPVYEVLTTKWLSFDDILFLKGIEAVVEIFYNSHQFEKTIAYLSRFYETPFDFYTALAGYYENSGLNEMSHKRLARYEHLLEFSKSITPETELVKAMLIYDLYARERLKSRPAWAGNQEEYKEQLALFYSDRKNVQTYMPGLADESYRQLRFETHVEYFKYDMEHAFNTGEAVEKEDILLFNYSVRNPLTYEAFVIHIDRTGEEIYND